VSKIAAALAAPFEEKDLKHRPGRSGMTYTYADVRAIDTRLDEVFGTMGWSFSWEVVDAANYVVRGRLIVAYEGTSKTIEEAGYPNAAITQGISFRRTMPLLRFNLRPVSIS